MIKTTQYTVFALLIGLLLFLWLRYDTSHQKNTPNIWGGSTVTISEWEYNNNSIRDLGRKWQEMGRQIQQAQHRASDETINYASVFLIVDLDTHAMWLECGGELIGHKFQLSDKLQWEMGYFDPDGYHPLESPAILAYQNTDRAERFQLRNYSPDFNASMGLSDSVSGFSKGMGGSGNRGSMNFSHVPDDWRQQPSVIFAEGSYESYKNHVQSLKESPNVTCLNQEDYFEENQKDWQQIEPRIYQAIEWQLSQLDMTISGLEVNHGPSYHAGHATVNTRQNIPLWRRFIPGMHQRYTQSPVFYIQYINDDIWYKHPKLPDRNSMSLNLEYLISANHKEIDSPETYIQQGRQLFSQYKSLPQSNWSHTLPNNIKVEIVGLSKHPSAGEPWWQPDGMAIDSIPFVNSDNKFMHFANDHIAREIVYRIVKPNNGGSTRSRNSFSPTRGQSSFMTNDWYGFNTFNFQVEAFVVEAGQKTIDFETHISQDGGPMYGVKFQNISLHPGQNKGAEIVELEPYNEK